MTASLPCIELNVRQPAGIRLKTCGRRKVHVCSPGSEKPWTVEVSADIRTATFHATRMTPAGRVFPGLWIETVDGQLHVYSVASGRLRYTGPRPGANPMIRRALGRLNDEYDRSTRYAVVFTIRPDGNSFYDFSNGQWHSNEIPPTAMVKNRALAMAAARVLTEARRKRAVFGGTRSRALQVVAFEPEPPRCITRVRGGRGYGWYVPRLSIRSQRVGQRAS